MFEINKKTVRKVLSDLQAQLKQINQIIFGIEAIFLEQGQENREIYMTERLSQELEEIKVQRKKMLDLFSSLRIILELYEETELELLEYEGKAIRHPFHETAWIPVNFSEEIVSFIRQIKIEEGTGNG